MTQIVEALARRYHDELLRVLRTRLRSDRDAEDLAQEAYVRLLRYGSLRSGEELRRMLFRIAENLVTDHWRWQRLRSNLHQAPLEDLDKVESGQPDQLRRIAAEQLLGRLEELIPRMPAKRREVFLLSRLYGLTYPQIAARCGISLKTVEKHLTLALAECRREVGDDAMDSL